jgi:transposase
VRTVVIFLPKDNAAPHSAKATKKWFGRQGVVRDEWFPPHSPDLNLIEHVWAQMAQAMRARTVRTRNELVQALKEEWAKVDSVMCQRLYESMKDRLQAVIDADGGHTRY